MSPIEQSLSEANKASGISWNEPSEELPFRPPGHDGRTVRVVSGRGYRYVLPFPYKLQ